MAFEQMTLSDWMEIKENIRKDLNNVKHAFVRVGYHLRRIRDDEMYKQDGYATLADFAKEEYGLEASTVSRLISINEKFSVDGYSAQLLPEYEDFKQASLTEMLALPVSDLQMVTPETSREDIRDLKRFNKAAAGTDDFTLVVEEFCRQNQELIKDLYTYSVLSSTAERDLMDMINPSGSRTFKKGLYFLSFTDSAVKVKKFGGTPYDLTYQNFVQCIEAILGSQKREDAWENHFGYPEGEKIEDIMPTPAEEPAQVETEEIAPAQLSPETRMDTECEADSEGEENEAGEEEQSVENDDRDTAGASGEAVEAGGEPAGDDEGDAAAEHSERAAEPGIGGIPIEAEGDQETAAEPERQDHQEEQAEKEESESKKDVIAPAQKAAEPAEVQSAAGPENKYIKAENEYMKEKILKTLDTLRIEIESEMWLTAEARVNSISIYLKQIRNK